MTTMRLDPDEVAPLDERLRVQEASDGLLNALSHLAALHTQICSPVFDPVRAIEVWTQLKKCLTASVTSVEFLRRRFETHV